MVNNTGYVLTVGPDEQGRYIDLQPGDEWPKKPVPKAKPETVKAKPRENTP